MLDVFIGRFEADSIAVVTNNAGEVPAGVRFTRLVVEKVAKNGLNSTYEEVESFPIDVVVRDISLQKHWKSVSAWPTGWGAGLQLEGEDLANAREIVQRKRTDEYVHLQAAT